MHAVLPRAQTISAQRSKHLVAHAVPPFYLARPSADGGHVVDSALSGSLSPLSYTAFTHSPQDAAVVLSHRLQVLVAEGDLVTSMGGVVLMPHWLRPFATGLRYVVLDEDAACGAA